jgi:hypothetical protein
MICTCWTVLKSGRAPSCCAMYAAAGGAPGRPSKQHTACIFRRSHKQHAHAGLLHEPPGVPTAVRRVVQQEDHPAAHQSDISQTRTSQVATAKAQMHAPAAAHPPTCSTILLPSDSSNLHNSIAGLFRKLAGAVSIKDRRQKATRQGSKICMPLQLPAEHYVA